MSELVANCPRCRAKLITFDLIGQHQLRSNGWQRWYEAFCVCRGCDRTTTFILAQRANEHGQVLDSNYLAALSPSVNEYLEIRSHLSLKDMAAVAPPDHLPEDLEAAFREAATCVAVQCPNAAATMFRLCIDLATQRLLPEGETAGLNSKVRRSLGLRLHWLFETGQLPENLRELSKCIQQDGNDGAHTGNLTMNDAKDLRDFTTALLEAMYTVPHKLELAAERRNERRRTK